MLVHSFLSCFSKKKRMSSAARMPCTAAARRPALLRSPPLVHAQLPAARQLREYMNTYVRIIPRAHLRVSLHNNIKKECVHGTPYARVPQGYTRTP